jgi:hypothetical protein
MGLISATVGSDTAELSAAVGQRIVCVAWNRSGATSFQVTPDTGGTWVNRLVEATLPADDGSRRSLAVAELLVESTVAAVTFTAAWDTGGTGALWMVVEEGAGYDPADVVVADSGTATVNQLAAGAVNAAAGDWLAIAAMASRDGDADPVSWSTTDIEPALVGGGTVLLDHFAGVGEGGGNAGAAGYLVQAGQGAGSLSDTLTLPVGESRMLTAALLVFSTGGAATLDRHHLRDTQTEPGTGGTVFDLSPTQGTGTTVGSGNVASTTFVEVLRFQATVGAGVGGAAFPSSMDMASVSAATMEWRWRVQRYDSSGVLQASSNYSPAHNTAGVKTADLTLDTTWSAGDRLAVSVEMRKVSGGGNRSFTLNINDADTYIDALPAAAGDDHEGDGTACTAVLTPAAGSGTPAAAGAGAGCSTILVPGAGVGSPAATGAGDAAGVVLAPGAGSGTAAVAGAGQAAQLVLTPGTGSGEASGSGSGDGQPAVVVLTPDVGVGAPALAGSGQATPLTLIPATATGSPAMAAAGTTCTLTLAPQTGTGQGGSDDPAHSGDGTACTAVLAPGAGAGAPATAGDGTSCTMVLAPGLGSAAFAPGTPTAGGTSPALAAAGATPQLVAAGTSPTLTTGGQP